jgi:hypothetical protein
MDQLQMLATVLACLLAKVVRFLHGAPGSDPERDRANEVSELRARGYNSAGSIQIVLIQLL